MLFSGEETLSTLRKLRLGVCRGIESLPQELMESDFPCLEYLNVRKSKITDLHTLSKLFMERTLTTLILDGQKIANTGILEKLLGKQERERDRERKREREFLEI